jgi:hypothetical protein
MQGGVHDRPLNSYMSLTIIPLNCMHDAVDGIDSFQRFHSGDRPPFCGLAAS